MIEWLASASLPFLTAAIFLAMYLAVVLVSWCSTWWADVVTTPHWVRSVPA